MTNQEDVILEVLRQGVEKWNKWRYSNPSEKIILRKRTISGMDLSGANLSGVDFNDVNMIGTNLREANLNEAYLNDVDLRMADLSMAILGGAHLNDADMSKANLSKANLRGANLSDAWLIDANLSGADLRRANLTGADLRRANLENAECGGTIFAHINLSSIQGLASIRHLGPSTIGVDTLYLSNGKIPEVFLRGCGVSENIITYLPALPESAIQFYSCFISYSHTDKEFAKLLYNRLQGVGIRCWLDEHQLNLGDPLHPTIYEAIRVYDKIILCCSRSSLASWWVEKEFMRGMKKEEDYRLPLIIPLNLDGYLFDKECSGWVADEIKQRNVGDFTKWNNLEAFEKSFLSVLNALRQDGGKPPPPKPKLQPK